MAVVKGLQGKLAGCYGYLLKASCCSTVSAP